MSDHREDHADRHQFGGPDQLNLAGYPGLGVPADAWTAYTPTIGGTGWALGNGTFEARYARIGRTIILHIRCIFGTTSTFGTGALTFTLPTPPTPATLVWHGHSICSDVGTGFAYGFCQIAGGVLSPWAFFVSGARVGGSQVTNTQPHTWAATDHVTMEIVYEAAA